MDEHTLTVLDFPRVREVLAGLALTEMGRQAAERLRPGLDGAAVEHEFRLTEELLRVGEDPPLGQCVISGRCSIPTASGRVSSARRNCWRCARHWKEWERGPRLPDETKGEAGAGRPGVRYGARL